MQMNEFRHERQANAGTCPKHMQLAYMQLRKVHATVRKVWATLEKKYMYSKYKENVCCSLRKKCVLC